MICEIYVKFVKKNVGIWETCRTNGRVLGFVKFI